jgi:galactose-1-phosphate uridylyltransferase
LMSEPQRDITAEEAANRLRWAIQSARPDVVHSSD